MSFLIQLAKQDSTSNCDLFFNIGGSITCHYKEVESFIKLNNKDDKQTLTFQSDHIFPGNCLTHNFYFSV